MFKSIRIVAIAALLSLCFTGISFAGSIGVFAAASLTNAFTELKDAYIKENPDTTIELNFAASNPLLRQIETGAPADIFASADQATMNTAVEKDLIDTASRKNFVENSLVLIAPIDESKGLINALGLEKADIKNIAVGNPESVPAGRYTKEVLEFTGVWAQLEPKLIFGESVRQVLDYVSRGEVNAGFVYSTDAKQAFGKVRVVEVMKGKTPILYPIAIVKDSKNKAEAQKFMDFVTSTEGMKILEAYGFAPVK